MEALLRIGDPYDTEKRIEAITAYDIDVIERGSKAVKQSLDEARHSLDMETVENMLMVKKGLEKTA